MLLPACLPEQCMLRRTARHRRREVVTTLSGLGILLTLASSTQLVFGRSRVCFVARVALFALGCDRRCRWSSRARRFARFQRNVVMDCRSKLGRSLQIRSLLLVGTLEPDMNLL